MAVFRYEGTSFSGQRMIRVVEAFDEFEALEKARATCRVVSKVTPVKERSNFLTMEVGSGRIKPKVIAIMCSQFATIISAGMSMSRCVELVADQTSDKGLKAILTEVADDVSAGHSLATSFENKGGKKLPVLFYETIRAGEQAGTLDQSFQTLHKYYDKTSKTKAKVAQALTYPVFVIVLAIVVVAVVMVAVIPTFKDILSSYDSEMPVITQVLIDASDFVAANILWIVLVLAAVIAELFHNKFGNFVKSSLFVPVIASAILVGTLWFTLLSPRGVVNSIIHAFGLPSVNWLGGKLTSMLSVCIVSVWKNVGYFLVIYFAGIMDIPRSLYEAAEVDGANAFQRFFKITLPGLSSVTFLVVTLGTIWSFQVFDLVYTMTGGGPGTSTVTLVLTTYNAAFKEYNMGYASAVAMLMFVFVLAVSGLQKLLLKGGED